MVSVREWHWTGKPNFGDALGKPILEHFIRLDVEYTPHLSGADVVAVGSVLGLLPHGWAGAVLGAGLLREGLSARLRDARVYALRGPLSARGIPGDYALGDPGLLASHLIPSQSKRYRLGIIPHWSDWEDASAGVWKFDQYGPIYINVADDPLRVIAMIASCEKIVTSSLHGAIVADAFGIPRRIEYAKRFDREGGVFKFRDYSQSIGMPFELGVTMTANRFKVEQRQDELIDAIRAFETIASRNA